MKVYSKDNFISILEEDIEIDYGFANSLLFSNMKKGVINKNTPDIEKIIVTKYHGCNTKWYLFHYILYAKNINTEFLISEYLKQIISDIDTGNYLSSASDTELIIEYTSAMTEFLRFEIIKYDNLIKIMRDTFVYQCSLYNLDAVNILSSKLVNNILE